LPLFIFIQGLFLFGLFSQRFKPITIYTFEDFLRQARSACPHCEIRTPKACYLYHSKETLPINELKRITTFGGCADLHH
jgi:hypothetical protein